MCHFNVSHRHVSIHLISYPAPDDAYGPVVPSTMSFEFLRHCRCCMCLTAFSDVDVHVFRPKLSDRSEMEDPCLAMPSSISDDQV